MALRASFFFHVEPTDPLAFWTAVITLMLVSIAAGYIPALRQVPSVRMRTQKCRA